MFLRSGEVFLSEETMRAWPCPHASVLEQTLPLLSDVLSRVLLSACLWEAMSRNVWYHLEVPPECVNAIVCMWMRVY